MPPPGPSPPAPLTGTAMHSEGPVALSHDGSIAAFMFARHDEWGEAILRPWPVVVDLRADCGSEAVEGLRLVHDSPNTATGTQDNLDVRPGLSADGSLVAYWQRYDRPEPAGGTSRWYRILLRGSGVTLPLVEPIRTPTDGRTPRPQLSPNGKTLWALEGAVNAPPGSAFWSLDAADPAHECDVPSIVPPTAQPAFAADAVASYFVAEHNDGSGDIGSRFIARYSKPGDQWCPPTGFAGASMQLAMLNPSSDPGTWEFEDVHSLTLSADGRMAAWTSYVDHCNGAAYNPNAITNRDLWLWLDEGLAPPAFADITCGDLDPASNGTLARIRPTTVFESDESRAVIGPDGSFVLFVSNADVALNNVNNRPVAYRLDLTAPAGDYTQISPTLRTNESVEALAVSGDGRVAAFTLDRDAGEFLYDLDNFLVSLDQGAEVLSPETPGLAPADEPFDAQILACSTDGVTAEIQVRLRQWKGAPRTVIVTGEVTDDSAGAPVVAALGPIVQDLGPGQSVDVVLSGPFSGAVLTCAARAIDARPGHPDIVIARAQP